MFDHGELKLIFWINRSRILDESTGLLSKIFINCLAGHCRNTTLNMRSIPTFGVLFQIWFIYSFDSLSSGLLYWCVCFNIWTNSWLRIYFNFLKHHSLLFETFSSSFSHLHARYLFGFSKWICSTWKTGCKPHALL